MRYREPFSVFPRTLKSGRIVFYYQTYRQDGSRTNPRSTGQTTKTAARQWCLNRWKAGTLVEQKRTLTFRDYTQTWFVYDKCDYIKGKLKRGGSYSRSNAANMRLWLERYILPYFGTKPINEITPKDIENWLYQVKTDTGHTATSVNHYFSTLRIILNEAERLGDIFHSPVKAVKPLVSDTPEKGILTDAEIAKLFDPQGIEEIWEGQKIQYVINLLAYTCGLRQGECLGLLWEHVHDDYIHVCHSWEKRYQTLKDTKTKEIRDIAISSSLHKMMLEMKLAYGIRGEFVFSLDGGRTPMFDTTVRKWHNRALRAIGISEEERKDRKLSFHSLRHQLNTYMRRRGESDAHIRKITGHSSPEMTDHYDHTDARHIAALMNLQEEIMQ